MYDDSPDWKLVFTVYECLYHNHPLRDDIAGSVECIAEITPELLYACTDAFYRPQNMTLAVAGNVTMDTVLAAVERAHLAAKPGEVRRHPGRGARGRALCAGASLRWTSQSRCWASASRRRPARRKNRPAHRAFVRGAVRGGLRQHDARCTAVCTTRGPCEQRLFGREPCFWTTR